MQIETHVLNDIYAQRFRGKDARYALLISHGGGGHSGIYNVFCEHHAARGVDVWAYDGPGHGRSTMNKGRGQFEFADWVAACADYAAHIKAETGLPVIALGSSLGVAATFSALYSDAIAGAVLMGAASIPSAEGGMIPTNHPLRSPALDFLDKDFAGRALRVDIGRMVNFDIDYGYAGAGEAKRLDPFNTWMYDFASWRSVFTYDPRIPASRNEKKILMAVGEHDAIFSVDKMQACARSIAGPVQFEVVRGAGHQLMLFETAQFSSMVDGWASDVISGAAAASVRRV